MCRAPRQGNTLQVGRGGTASNTGIKEAQGGQNEGEGNSNWVVNDWKAIPDSFYHTAPHRHTLLSLSLHSSLWCADVQSSSGSGSS